jgi:TatD DNase family protein
VTTTASTSNDDGGVLRSKAGAIDTHCHLFLMDQEPAEVVATAREGGVERLICVGIDPETSRRSLELADSLRGVFATAGMHPHTASAFDRAAGAAIEELLGDPRVVGIGECGLDYFRKLSPIEDQQRVFRTHIALSRETGKPLVVHIRDAWDDGLRILEEEDAEHVVLHCFTGDAAVAAEVNSRGYVVSFAGNLTYPRNGHMREAAALLDPARVVTETDSPFLSPQPLRGRDNHPVNVMAVVEQLAELRGAERSEVVAITANAAVRAFALEG